jgi:hypothetical protein
MQVGPRCASNSGSSTVITVPLPGSLSTAMLPPSSRMYWCAFVRADAHAAALGGC